MWVSFSEPKRAEVATSNPMRGIFSKSKGAGVAIPDPMRGIFSESKGAGVAIPDPMRGSFHGVYRVQEEAGVGVLG